MAENEIGVSGSVSAQVGPDMNRTNYGADYEFPMHEIPQSYQDQQWIKNTQGLKVWLKGKEYTITCVSMPQGAIQCRTLLIPTGGAMGCTGAKISDAENPCALSGGRVSLGPPIRASAVRAMRAVCLFVLCRLNTMRLKP